MMHLRPILALAATLCVPWSVSWALSLGPVRANPVLGQPLNAAVPVSLAPGETLPSNCVNADVLSGDLRVPAGSVRVRVVPGRQADEVMLRIATTSAIEEPVVTLTLSVGCGNSATRTVTLLADPPSVRMAQVVVIEPAVQAPAAPAVAPPRSTSAAPSRVQTAARPSAAPREAAKPRTTASTVRGGDTPGSPGRPTLKLDAPTAPLASTAAAVAPSADTAQALQQAASAAVAAQSSLKALELELAQLRAQAQQQAQQYAALQAQLAQAQAQAQSVTRTQGQPAWLLPLLAVLAGTFAFAALWFWWCSRQALASRAAADASRSDWWDSAVARAGRSTAVPSTKASQFGSRTGAAPFQDRSGDGRRPSGFSSRLPLPAAATAAQDEADDDSRGLDSMMSPRTVQSSPPTRAPALASTSSMLGALDQEPGALSVDEQIDIEQQADFFIALGHDDQAVDLLMANLRSTAAGSPLPFLKLLEIHRRLGQREEYERMRDRFNQRFNSVAPDWSADPAAGRHLEQYPLVMGRIQAAWHTPLDAMVELEALLFGRSAQTEVFDLPAYQEALFLYQVARELHNSEPRASAFDDVDVLLPIGSSSSPTPAVGEGSIALRPEFNAGRRVMLDLDVDGRPNDGAVWVTGERPSTKGPDE